MAEGDDSALFAAAYLAEDDWNATNGLLDYDILYLPPPTPPHYHSGPLLPPPSKPTAININAASVFCIAAGVQVLLLLFTFPTTFCCYQLTFALVADLYNGLIMAYSYNLFMFYYF